MPRLREIVTAPYRGGIERINDCFDVRDLRSRLCFHAPCAQEKAWNTMNNPSHQAMFPEGDWCALKSWEAILPDPDNPGKFRLVQHIIEQRLVMKPGFVDADGNPVIEPEKQHSD
jgi:hypothetical protein